MSEVMMSAVKIESIDSRERKDAIRMIRQATGWSMAEAYDFVDDVLNGIERPAIKLPSEDAQDYVSTFMDMGIAANLLFEEKETVDDSRLKEPDQEDGEFVPSVLPKEIQGLSREQTIKVLRQVGSIAIEAEEYEEGISDLTAFIEKGAKEADALREGLSMAAVMITLGVTIIAGIIGFAIGSIILAVVFGIAMFFIASKIVTPIDVKKHAVENNQKADQYMLEHVVPLQEQLEICMQEKDKLSQSGKLAWAIDIVGKDLFNSECIFDLQDLIRSRRADTLKEALNKYDDELHKRHMEEMQSAIQNASEVAAEEAVKQTARMKSIDKNTRQAATAAKVTAATSYGTYRNAKKINRNTKAINRKLK